MTNKPSKIQPSTEARTWTTTSPQITTTMVTKCNKGSMTISMAITTPLISIHSTKNKVSMTKSKMGSSMVSSAEMAPQAITSSEAPKTDSQKSNSWTMAIIEAGDSSSSRNNAGRTSSSGRGIITTTMITPCTILMTLTITTSISKTQATPMEEATTTVKTIKIKTPRTKKTTKAWASMIDTKDSQLGINSSTTIGPCTRDNSMMLLMVCLMMLQWAVLTDTQMSSQTVATASSSITTVVSTCSEIILNMTTTTTLNQMNGPIIGHSASDTKTTTTWTAAMSQETTCLTMWHQHQASCQMPATLLSQVPFRFPKSVRSLHSHLSKTARLWAQVTKMFIKWTHSWAALALITRFHKTSSLQWSTTHQIRAWSKQNEAILLPPQIPTTKAILWATVRSQPPNNSFRVRWACQPQQWASVEARLRSCPLLEFPRRQTRPLWALHLWAKLQANLISGLLSPTPSEHEKRLSNSSKCCNWISSVFSIWLSVPKRPLESNDSSVFWNSLTLVTGREPWQTI